MVDYFQLPMGRSIPFPRLGLDNLQNLAPLFHRVKHRSSSLCLDPVPPILSHLSLAIIIAPVANSFPMEDPDSSRSDGDSFDEGPFTPLTINATTYTGLNRKPRGHEWTQEERKVLCVARLWFQSSGNTNQQTFREIKKLLALYFSNTPGGSSLQDITTNAVVAQCNEVSRIRKDPWTQIASQSRQQLASRISCLQQIIDVNGLDLVQRESKYILSPRPPITPRRKRYHESSNDDDYEKYVPRRRSGRSRAEAGIAAKLPKKHLKNSSPVSMLNSPLANKGGRLQVEEIDSSPPSSASSSGSPSPNPNSWPIGVQASANVPQGPYKIIVRPGHSGVCYRFWDDNSQTKLTGKGFLARGALSEPGGLSPLPPPKPFSPQFRAAAKSHLTMKHTANGSPFISIVKTLSPDSFHDINREF